MDIASLAGQYGACVVDTLVDRLNTSSIQVKRAWLRKEESPFDAPIDVTKGFIRALSKHGGSVGSARMALTPKELTAPPPTKRATVPGYGFWNWWGGSNSNNQQDSASATAKAINDQDSNSALFWLCVCFSVPGNSEYVVTYLIPREEVVFPPLLANPKSIMPLERRILQAAIVAIIPPLPEPDSDQTKEEEEEEDDIPVSLVQEDNILLDFTVQAQRMSGPNGDFFGRASSDMRLALADVTDGGPSASTWNRILEHIASRGSIRAVMCMADGTEREVDLRDYRQ